MLQANALTTLERMKKQLGIPLTDDSEDFKIEMLINAASDAICEYCKREFQIKQYTDEPIENGELRFYPVVEIISENPDGTKNISRWMDNTSRGLGTNSKKSPSSNRICVHIICRPIVNSCTGSGE